MAEPIKEFMTAFRKTRGWSLRTMAEKLGYGSANSLERISQGKARPDSVMHFVKLLRQMPDLALTPEESSELDALAERMQLSDDAYHATQLLHSLLRNDQPAPYPITVHSDQLKDNVPLAVAVHGKHITQVMILNCINMPFYHALTNVNLTLDFPIRHYLVIDELASHIVQRVLWMLPLTALPNYRGFITHLSPNAPCGLLQSDMVLCEYEEEGEVRCAVMIANRPDHFDAFVSKHSLEDLVRFILPDQSIFRSVGDHRLNKQQSYTDYLRVCTEVERDHTVMRIKPDFGMDQLPPRVLLEAIDVSAAPPGEQSAIAREAAEAADILEARYQNYLTKRQMQYHVYKKQAVWHFVKTGLLSDHMWLLQPFTPAQRLEILQSTLEALHSNPYLHITFLKNENAFRNDEITWYENVGLSILHPQTDYRLGAGHREVLIHHENFLHVYRQFYLNSIIGHHTITEQQAISELKAMIAYLQDQYPDL